MAVGGLECREGTTPANARCFATTLDRALSRGEPFRSIAAIELVASFVSLLVFTKNEKGGERGVYYI